MKLWSSLRETELLWLNKKWEISYVDICTKKEACVHETAKKGKFGFIFCYYNKILEIINFKRIKIYFGSVPEFSTHKLAHPHFACGNAVMYHGMVHTIEQICSPQDGQDIKQRGQSDIQRHLPNDQKLPRNYHHKRFLSLPSSITHWGPSF